MADDGDETATTALRSTIAGQAEQLAEGERRLARREAELHRLNETLEAQVAERTAERDRIWRNSLDLLLVVGFDGAVQATNPAWEATLGYLPHELRGIPVGTYLHPDDLDSAIATIERLRTERVPRMENRLRHKDGTWRWISWATVAFGDRIYAVGRDVTDEKRQAETLALTEAALRQAQKMEAVGQLTGGIAHDFNNMLQSVASGLELMSRRIEQGRPDEAMRYVDAARRGVDRATALTQRLLAFGRRQALAPEPVDLDTLVRGMGELIAQTVGPAITVRLNLQDGCWPVRCDANQMESALLNLAINARDAMIPNGGELCIETAHAQLAVAEVVGWDGATPGDFVRVTVRDTGCGMTPDVVAHAFDPFFTTKPVGQGTGLGLSQLYGFVQQSDGLVRLESQAGQGTSVHLFLPRDRTAFAAEPTVPLATIAADAEKNGLLAGITILLVEDEAAVRGLAAEALGDLGCRVLPAADGASGLQVLHRAAPRDVDILITDVGLPGGLNGRQLADAARALRPDLPVLLITGYAGDGETCLANGMEILVKPFSLGALTERVAGMVRARPAV